MEKLNISTETQDMLIFVEEYKKSIRHEEPDEEENLKEIDYCRRYSKTRSMGQD
jgi:hypothetical protein